MDDFKYFLESSSINGLSHIASSRKLSRLFWITVVVTGFLGASFLINSSFQAWNESPINTVIETLSIDKIGFPQISVCPPKNTFTSLNYDLLMANHTSRLDEKQISLLINTTVVKMQELENEIATANFLEDVNRFRNWYRGIDECFKKFPTDFIETTSELEGRISLICVVSILFI